MVFGDPKRIPLKQRYLETAFCHSEQKPLQKNDFKLVVFTDPLGNLRFQQDYSQENLELDTSRYGERSAGQRFGVIVQLGSNCGIRFLSLQKQSRTGSEKGSEMTCSKRLVFGHGLSRFQVSVWRSEGSEGSSWLMSCPLSLCFVVCVCVGVGSRTSRMVSLTGRRGNGKCLSGQDRACQDKLV